jgi:hypothetical protein
MRSEGDQHEPDPVVVLGLATGFTPLHRGGVQRKGATSRTPPRTMSDRVGYRVSTLARSRTNQHLDDGQPEQPDRTEP